MTSRPPASRNVLKWHIFEEKGPGIWVLHLMPPYYSELFCEQASELMRKARTGWRDNKNGKTKFAYFHNLSDPERQTIQKFIEDYRQFVILGLNRNIDSFFTDELNSCLALDYTAASPEALYRNQRTPIGQLWHDYKYDNNRKILPDIVEQMIRGLHRLPGLDKCQEHFLSYVPPKPNKRHDLPREMTDKLVDRLNDADSLRVSPTIIQPTLVIDKPAFKKLNYEKKTEAWQGIYGIKRGSSIEPGQGPVGHYH